MPQQLYDEFTATYAQLQGQSKSGRSVGLLKALGISPANWLSDLKNEGTEDVEGTKTIHISGTANVSKLVEDLKAIAQKAGTPWATSTPTSSIGSTTSSSRATST